MFKFTGVQLMRRLYSALLHYDVDSALHYDVWRVIRWYDSSTRDGERALNHRLLCSLGHCWDRPHRKEKRVVNTTSLAFSSYYYCLSTLYFTVCLIFYLQRRRRRRRRRSLIRFPFPPMLPTLLILQYYSLVFTLFQGRLLKRMLWGIERALISLPSFFRSYFHKLTRRRPTPFISNTHKTTRLLTFFLMNDPFAQVRRESSWNTPAARAVCHIHVFTVALRPPKDDAAFREAGHVQNFSPAFWHQPTRQPLPKCKMPSREAQSRPLSFLVSISFSPSLFLSSSLHDGVSFSILFSFIRARGLRI